MFNKLKLFDLMILGLAFCFALGIASQALAAEHTLFGDYEIIGGLAVKGDLYADHNVINFNPAGYLGVDPILSFQRGDSLIKEMGDLYIVSDDYVHIGPSIYGSSVGKV